MTLTRQMEASEFVPIEPGTYSVTCVGITTDVMENPQFGNGAVIRFSLSFDDMVDTEGGDVIRDPIANDKLTPMSKLTGWLGAFGIKVAIGGQVDLEECIGKQALATVTSVDKGDRTYDKVTALMPVPKTAAPQQAIDVSELSIAAWWLFLRSNGFTQKQAKEAAAELYKGREPKDLTGEERESVFATLEGSSA